MQLYHFTSSFHWPAIKRSGLTRGDVPTSPFGGVNAVWLTTQGTPDTQGWTAGSGFDKGEIRITVDIPDGDSNLKSWKAYAQEQKVEKAWYDALDRTGGGGSNSWYLYFGTIPPNRFKAVDRFKNASWTLSQALRRHAAAGKLGPGWLYHNIPSADIPILEKEGMQGGSFTDRAGFDFGRDAWVAVRKEDLRNISAHQYGDAVAHEVQWGPGSSDKTWLVVPPQKIALVDRHGRLIRMLG